MRRILITLLVLIAALGVGGAAALAVNGHANSATRPRLERAMATSFANQYVQQAALLGRSGITTQSLQARAMCDKHGPDVADIGPGSDWICLLGWVDPNVPMPPEGYGKFEVALHSNDCFTATGPTKLVGFSMLTDKRGRSVTNPAFEFDGCFDPKADNTPTGTLFPSVLNISSAVLTPDASGHVAVQVTCGTGAEGCAGQVTATAAGVPLGTFAYSLKEEATAVLQVPTPIPAGTTGVTFAFTSTTGMAPPSAATVPLQP